jgi:hypothetical protein
MGSSPSLVEVAVRRVVPAVVLAFSLCGCSAASFLPPTPDAVTSHTFDAPLEVTWPALVRSIAEQRESFETLDKSSGVIITRVFIDFSGYGAGEWLKQYGRPPGGAICTSWGDARHRFNIYVEPVGANQTRVKIDLTLQGHESTCGWCGWASTGRMEGEVFNRVGTILLHRAQATPDTTK